MGLSLSRGVLVEEDSMRLDDLNFSVLYCLLISRTNAFLVGSCDAFTPHQDTSSAFQSSSRRYIRKRRNRLLYFLRKKAKTIAATKRLL